MRGRRGTGVLLAVVAVLGAAGVFAASASSQGVCHVQLRVDVFGGGHSWALQGGLNTGKTATLRAVENGCAGLDHILGRRVGGSAAPLSPHPCAGGTCFWLIRSRAMTAIDFQAYARAHSGGLVHSNIVRVAWAGGHVNTWTGTWQRHEVVGDLILSQQGSGVTGHYTWNDGSGRVTGNVSGSTLNGTFNETHYSGTFTLTMSGGTFSGNFSGTNSDTGGPVSGPFGGTCTAGPCLTNH